MVPKEQNKKGRREEGRKEGRKEEREGGRGKFQVLVPKLDYEMKR